MWGEDGDEKETGNNAILDNAIRNHRRLLEWRRSTIPSQKEFFHAISPANSSVVISVSAQTPADEVKTIRKTRG